jgi:hypothetical protein
MTSFKVNTTDGKHTVVDFTLHDRSTATEHNVEFSFDEETNLVNVDVTLGKKEVTMIDFQTDLSRL